MIRRRETDFHQPLSLFCEELESRFMLSTVEILAAGTTNEEQLELIVDGETVQVWNDLGGDADDGEFVTLDFTSPESFTANQVRIQFTNDEYDPDNGIDRNVRVDAILVDGVRYEAEASDVFSTGTWLPADGVSPGFRQNEYLHTVGYFQFADSDSELGGSLLSMRARGYEGNEEFILYVDDDVVAAETVGTEFESFNYRLNELISPGQVRIEFTNDQWDPENGIDANLVVDYIAIDSVIYETEDPSVFSTGTWLPEDGIQPGFRENEYLHADGYLQYADPVITPPDDIPANVILVVADGLGPEHVLAGGYFVNGVAGQLSFELLPVQTLMSHNNIFNEITDSAASGTALATGFKVANGVVSVRSPGNGEELETVLEYYSARGKSTGLVTTSFVTDATPSTFGAHELSRGNQTAIANDYLTQTQPDLIMGGFTSVLPQADLENAGYTFVSDREQLLGLDTETVATVAGLFGQGELPPAGTPGRDVNLPDLTELTTAALNILDNNTDGFFLLVEHEGTDTYGHANEIEGTVRSVAEVADAVDAILQWQALNPDTLIIVTSDHETGGLKVLETTPEAGEIPEASWSTFGHTPSLVPVYAIGPGSEQINGVAQIDNTDIHEILTFEYQPNRPVTFDGLTVRITSAQHDRHLQSAVGGDVETTTDQNVLGLWQMVEIDDNQYLLQNIATGGYLDYDEDNVDTSDSPSSDDEWELIPVGDHFFFRNTESGLYLHADGASESYNVDTSDAASLDDQWLITIV